MGKVVRLTESDLVRIVKRVIKEQSVIGAPNYGVIDNGKTYDYNLLKDFLESREKIETKAKILYNPSNLDNPMSYQNMKDKEDAFCHQTASAYATSLFGENIAYIIGQMNELRGGFRIFFKGGKNTPKYTKFSSGYQMDTSNNNIGIKLAKQYPKKTLDEYMRLVNKNINNGIYYNKSNKYMKK